MGTRDEDAGLRLNKPAPDWRGYSRLRLNLVNPGPRSRQLMIRIHDAAHDQCHEGRFNLPFTLAASSQQILEIPLQDIENSPDRRRLDFGSVAGIVIFERSRPAPVGPTFCLHQTWLESGVVSTDFGLPPSEFLTQWRDAGEATLRTSCQ